VGIIADPPSGTSSSRLVDVQYERVHVDGKASELHQTGAHTYDGTRHSNLQEGVTHVSKLLKLQF